MMTPSRPIAVFVPSVRGGGAERAMLVFCCELVKLGREVDLVVANFDGALGEILPVGISLFDLKCRKTLLALPRLVAYLKKRRPAAMFATIMNANVVAAAAARIAGRHTPVILRESNAPLSSIRKGIADTITHRCVPFAYQFADGVIAVSQGVADELVMMAPKLATKVRVVPTPVISEDVIAQGQVNVDHPWFVHHDKPVVLSAGRLEPQKSFHTLIRAFAKLRKRRDARLIILGDGTQREHLRSEIRAHGIEEHVALPGFTKNPFAYMSRADAFALTSTFEGLPNVLVQAMAFGTPIVATDCRSGPSEVLCNGRYGRLVAVGDEEAIADGLEWALSVPRQRDASEYARVTYGARQAAQAYLAMAGLT